MGVLACVAFTLDLTRSREERWKKRQLDVGSFSKSRLYLAIDFLAVNWGKLNGRSLLRGRFGLLQFARLKYDTSFTDL